MTKWALRFLLVGVLFLVSCTDANQSNQPDEVAQGITCDYPSAGQPAVAVDPPSGTDVPNVGTVNATLQLNDEEIHLELDREQAPCTVNSFLSLAEQGYFDDTSCHRLVDYGIFILQCGDPTGTGRGGPGYSFADEVTDDATYPAGTVAMANAGPDTNGSQFFLVWADTPLDPDYTVFGTMDEASTAVIAGLAAQGVDATDGITPIAPAEIRGVTLG